MRKLTPTFEWRFLFSAVCVHSYLEVLYVDEDIRISKGSKGSMFVHTRSNRLQQ